MSGQMTSETLCSCCLVFLQLFNRIQRSLTHEDLCDQVYSPVIDRVAAKQISKLLPGSVVSTAGNANYTIEDYVKHAAKKYSYCFLPLPNINCVTVLYSLLSTELCRAEIAAIKMNKALLTTKMDSHPWASCPTIEIMKAMHFAKHLYVVDAQIHLLKIEIINLCETNRSPYLLFPDIAEFNNHVLHTTNYNGKKENMMVCYEILFENQGTKLDTTGLLPLLKERRPDLTYSSKKNSVSTVLTDIRKCLRSLTKNKITVSKIKYMLQPTTHP